MSKEQTILNDVVICVDDLCELGNAGITKGKVYKVLAYEGDKYLIANDYGVETYYYTRRFESAELAVKDKEGEPTFGVSKEGNVGANVHDLYVKAEAPVQLGDVEIFPSFKVNVLGQDYNVIFKPYDKDVVLNENLGYCDFYSKEIVVRANHPQSLLSNPNEDLIMLHTIRHEITHAFMFESGLDGSSEYARNEELIDWIAIQIPKMVNTMTDAVDKLDKLIGVEGNE